MPDDLIGGQLEKFRDQWSKGISGFYKRKFENSGIDPTRVTTWSQFRNLPFTTKAELIESEDLFFGQAVRMHQTSGTSTGKPLRWFDTRDSWEWIIGCWNQRFESMGITAADRAFFAFSFGPFLGFWSSFEATTRNGILAVSGGGMTTTARLRFIIDQEMTVVFCTPTYAVHMADVAAGEGIDLAASAVRLLVVAGEPGAGIPATRQKIETGWGARVFDHYGLTEVGPTASETLISRGNMVLHSQQYVAEVLHPGTNTEVPDGETGELVLTNLGRIGSQVVRYRTGDIVRKVGETLVGGILGRVDDMIQIRGNNLYPSAIEAVLFGFPEVSEFRVHVDQASPLADLRIIVEPSRADVAKDDSLKYNIERAIRDVLLFRAEVILVPPGTLPRTEMKSRRLQKPKPQ